MQRILAIFGALSLFLAASDVMFGAYLALNDLPPRECWGVLTTYAYWVMK